MISSRSLNLLVASFASVSADHYARYKGEKTPSLFDDAGNKSWDEDAHPRVEKGSKEAHGGQFTSKHGDSDNTKPKPQQLQPMFGSGYKPEAKAKQQSLFETMAGGGSQMPLFPDDATPDDLLSPKKSFDDKLESMKSRRDPEGISKNPFDVAEKPKPSAGENLLASQAKASSSEPVDPMKTIEEHINDHGGPELLTADSTESIRRKLYRPGIGAPSHQEIRDAALAMRGAPPADPREELKQLNAKFAELSDKQIPMIRQQMDLENQLRELRVTKHDPLMDPEGLKARNSKMRGIKTRLDNLNEKLRPLTKELDGVRDRSYEVMNAIREQDKAKEKQSPEAKQAASDMQPGLKNVASRMDQADAGFRDNLKELGGLTDEQAEKAFDYYKENKLFKSDAVMGKHTAKHGAYMDRDVIRKAAGLDPEPKADPSPGSQSGESMKTIPLRERKDYAIGLAKGGMKQTDLADHLMKRGVASVDARKLASDATFAAMVSNGLQEGAKAPSNEKPTAEEIANEWEVKKGTSVNASQSGTHVIETGSSGGRFYVRPNRIEHTEDGVKLHAEDPSFHDWIGDAEAEFNKQVKTAGQQDKKEKQDVAPSPARSDSPGIVMPSKTVSNDEAKPGDQLGLFGEATKAPAKAPPRLKVDEPKARQGGLFDTKGNPDQMDLFGDGAIPDDMVYKPKEEAKKPEFNMDSHVKLAADSIDKLRSSDVSRLLEQAPHEHMQAVADHIKANRPDLANKVDDELSDVLEDRGMSPAQKAAGIQPQNTPPSTASYKPKPTPGENFLASQEKTKAAEGFEPYEDKRFPGKWLSPFNKDKQGLGDTIHQSRSEAIKQSQQHADRHEREQSAEANRQQQAADEQARKAAFKESGLTPMQAAAKQRADKHLDEMVRHNGKDITTRRKILEKEIAQGRTPKKGYGANPYSMESEDTSRRLTKLEYDHAVGLHAKHQEELQKKSEARDAEIAAFDAKGFIDDMRSQGKSLVKFAGEKNLTSAQRLAAFKEFASQNEAKRKEETKPKEPSEARAAAQAKFLARQEAEAKPEESELDEAKPAEAKPSSKEPKSRTRTDLDFGEKIEVRKHRATATGPRAKKELTEAEKQRAAMPSWRKRYDVAEDANNPGQHFIVDRITKQPHGDTDPVRAGSFSAMLAKRLGKKGLKPSGFVNFQNKEDAEKQIAQIEVNRNHGITSRGGEGYQIYRKVSDRKTPTVMGGFKSREEAEAFMKNHPEKIIEHEFPRYETYQYLDRVERTGGKDHRNGKDSKPEDFQKAFNFRAGVFGNWQSGKDGQTSLNHAYDGLHDLSEALNLPPRAVSLNGQLAIGFGADGTGGKDSARAHYDPGKSLINLTKMKGAGSLAHEWFHALDHHLVKIAQPKATDHTTAGLNGRDWEGTRSELADAIKGIHKAIAAKSVTEAVNADGFSEHIKKVQEKEEKELTEAKANDKYIPGARTVAGQLWNLRKDMHTYAGYKKKTVSPESQKAFDEIAEKLITGDTGKHGYEGLSRGSYSGYPTYENLKELNKVYKQATGRSFHTNDSNSKGKDLYWALSRHVDQKQRVIDAAEGKTETKNKSTDYLHDARKLDETFGGDYYSKKEEMAARAFEAYIQDKLESKGIKSQYLGAKAKNADYPGSLRPFPHAEERTAINAAFDHLFKTLKHQSRSDEKGEHIELYSSKYSPVVLARYGFNVAEFADHYAKYRGEKTPNLFGDDDGPSWVTIGAQPGSDGKKTGGHPVKISDEGKMLTGHFAGMSLADAFGPGNQKQNEERKQPAPSQPDRQLQQEPRRLQIGTFGMKLRKPKPPRMFPDTEGYLRALHAFTKKPEPFASYKPWKPNWGTNESDTSENKEFEKKSLSILENAKHYVDPDHMGMLERVHFANFPNGRRGHQYSCRSSDHYAGKNQMKWDFGDDAEPVSGGKPSRIRSQQKVQEAANNGKLKIVGTTSDHDECERCGRKDLAKTIVVETLDAQGNGTGELHYYGSDCISKIMGKSEKHIETKVMEADYQKFLKSKKEAYSWQSSEDLEYDENACKLAADLYCAMAALYSVDRYEFREQLHPRDSIGRFSKVRSLVERPDIANHHSLFAFNQDTPTMLYVTDTMKGFRNLIAEASRRQQAKGGDGSEESLWQEIDKDKLRKMLAEVNAKDKEMRKNGGKGLDELFNYNGVIPKMIAERLSGGSRFFDPQKLKAKWHEQAPPPPAPKPDPAQAPAPGSNISIDIPRGKQGKQGKQATSAEPKAPEKPHDGLSTRKRNEVNKVIADLVSDNPEVIEEFRPILIDAWKRKSAEVNDRNNGFRQILGIFGKPKPGEATKTGEVTGMSPAQLMNLVKAARNKTLDPSTKKNFDVMVASAEAGPYGHLLEGNGEEGLMSLIEEGIKPMPDILDDDVAQLALGMAGPSFFQGFDPGEAPEDMPSEWEETPFSSHAAREYYRANFMETIGFDAYSQNHWEDQVRNNLGQWVTKDGLPSVQDTVPQGATLSKTVTDFAEQHFRGKRFRNSEQGWEILVDNRSIKKIAGRGNPSAFCLLAIDELIKNSVLLDSKPSIDNHPNEIAWHYFASPIIIGGKTHAAKLSVKETRTHGNKLYNLHAIEIEKGKPQEPARAKHTTQTLGFPSAVSIDKAWDKIKSGSDIYQFLIAPERYSHPSKAQAEAGNYRMKHVRIAGLDISIETPKGKRRRPEWPPMAADYGYIKGTTGKDGDHLDVFVGPKPNSEVVYVIDQSNKDGGFDEHKIMLGFIGMKNAVDCYKRCYTPGWKVGPVTAMTIGQFKNWIRDGKHKKPIEMQVSKYSSKIGRKYGWNEEDHPRGQPENKGQFVGTFPKKPTEDQIPSESNPHVIAGDMVAPRSQFKLKLLPLDRLTPTEDTDTPKIVDKYEKRFRNRKPVHPIVVDRFGKIRDGHHRFYAAKRAGLTHIWAMRQNSIRDMQQEQ